VLRWNRAWAGSIQVGADRHLFYIVARCLSAPLPPLLTRLSLEGCTVLGVATFRTQKFALEGATCVYGIHACCVASSVRWQSSWLGVALEGCLLGIHTTVCCGLKPACVRFNTMPSAHSAVCDRVHGQHACDSIPCLQPIAVCDRVHHQHACDSIPCLQPIQQCVTEFMVSRRAIQYHA
jgi:hypothetical protein